MIVPNAKPSEWKAPVIAVIGMGTGFGDLGATALEWIGEAEILIGSNRHLDLFPDYPGEKVPLKSPLSEHLEEIAHLSKERRTAILASGDPLFFGIGSRLSKLVGKERLSIVPNMTSVQTLCARLCEPWDDIEAISLHGRNFVKGMAEILHKLNRGRKVAIFTDPVHTPQWIARRLIESGLQACKVIIAEDLGCASERVQELRPSAVVNGAFSSLNLVLVFPDESRDGLAGGTEGGQIFGFQEEEFEREAGLITKMEVRAVVLALLQLRPGQVLWDLGAATGSVSIEAARVAGLKRVYAVEKSESRYLKLLQNLAKFNECAVDAIRGTASEVAERLSDPDRVFIGGSGDDLEKILEIVAGRLQPGGRVVQTIVLLNTLEKVRSFWGDRGFEISVTQLQVSRSVPTGKDLRFEALNPVFIASAWRNAWRLRSGAEQSSNRASYKSAD
jgi:precorrin-6B C5,15-methyltransferase / cobalt-precorrin-6B C5,C15-methyltransferase